ncbi:kinase-like protein [Aulographum hederae CBS 113979]|uniref:Kinase-like protein n=1 Tax=Aulographum hederae CBS 113979 TaxID=1176131 RepID=A0A6G1H1U0_9PEZI|nr:kinase-like protein [Aulographum hederae CBS 113979]
MFAFDSSEAPAHARCDANLVLLQKATERLSQDEYCTTPKAGRLHRPSTLSPNHRDILAGVEDAEDKHNMDIDTGRSMGGRDMMKTPPVRIASPSPHRFATQNAAAAAKISANEKLDFDALRKVAAKKKKKNQQKKGMSDAAPATTTVRGFYTPVTSAGEESDFSRVNTPKMSPSVKDLPSITSSPALRPTSAAGGISALKARLDGQLDGASTPSFNERPSTLRQTTGSRSDFSAATSNASETTSDAESSKTEMETYEVNIESDFASSHLTSDEAIAEKISNLHLDSVSRKMEASDFETLKVLGKGSFGKVMLVRQNGSGRLFAQKQLRKATLTVHKKLVERTKTERSILESVNRHPFVVKLFYAFQDHEKLYLILEYASGGELFHHLSIDHMFPEETASFYLAEVVLALYHLHKTLGVVYRDLKPENCLLDAEGHLLLTDFGLSKVSLDENDRCNSVLGTVGYMAPEIIQGKEYSFAVDWWSLGVLGCDLLTGSVPFPGTNPGRVQNDVVKKKLQLPYYLSPDAKDFLTRLLNKDPRKRLGSNMPRDFQTIKQHRFFRKLDWKKLEKRELVPPIQPFVGNPEDALNFSNEFTEMALSQIALDADEDVEMGAAPDPFGGFSYVASSSLLEGGMWGI